MAEFSHCHRDVWSAKPKIWSVWPFLEENCQALDKPWLANEREIIHQDFWREARPGSSSSLWVYVDNYVPGTLCVFTKSLGQSFWSKYCGYSLYTWRNGMEIGLRSLPKVTQLVGDRDRTWSPVLCFQCCTPPTSPRCPSVAGLECNSSIVPYPSYHLRYGRNLRGFCSCHHSNSEPARCRRILIFGKVFADYHLLTSDPSSTALKHTELGSPPKLAVTLGS